MGHSQDEKAHSRQRIVSAASRRIRQDGLNGFSIADVMKDAELTHGGFYGHFSSRAELIAAALDQALRESGDVYDPSVQPSLERMVGSYLSCSHRDSPSAGCAVSVLASEVARSDPETRAVMDAHLKKYIHTISQAMNGSEHDELAIPIACLMVGSLTLSRLIGEQGLSDKILKDASDYILSIASDAAESKHDSSAHNG